MAQKGINKKRSNFCLYLPASPCLCLLLPLPLPASTWPCPASASCLCLCLPASACLLHTNLSHLHEGRDPTIIPSTSTSCKAVTKNTRWPVQAPVTITGTAPYFHEKKRNSRLAKQRVESIITSPNCLVRRHLTIRLNTMFQAKEFPAGIANLHT